MKSRTLHPTGLGGRSNLRLAVASIALTGSGAHDRRARRTGGRDHDIPDPRIATDPRHRSRRSE